MSAREDGALQRRPVGFVAALASTMAMGAFLGFAFGVLAPVLVADLGVTSWQIGTLPSAMYAVGALLAPASGHLTDRWGPGRVALGVGPVVAVALVALAWAQNYTGLVVAAVIGGVALSASNPATNRLVADRLSGAAAGWAMGIKQAGVSVGAVVAGAVLPTLALGGGLRRAAYLSAGLVVVAAAACASPYMRGRPPDGAASATHLTAPRSVAARPVRDLALFAVSLGAANGAVAAYLVLYATDALGVGTAPAGALAAVLGATAAVTRVLWARLGVREGVAGRLLRALALLAVVSLTALVLAGPAGNWALWVAAAGLGASAASWQGLIMLAAVRRVPTESVGRSSAFVVRAFYAGYVVGPLVFGLVLRLTSDRYSIAWVLTMVTAVVAWLSIRSDT